METPENNPPDSLTAAGKSRIRYQLVKEWFAKTEMAAVVGLLVALYLILLVQVFFRYVMSSPLIWTEEVARFVFVWLVFIGAAVVTTRNEHIAVTFLSDRLPQPLARFTIRLAALITMTAAAVVAWSSVGFLEATAQLLSPAVQLPMAWVYAAPTLGFILIALHSVEFVLTGEGPPPGELPAGEGI